MVDLNLMLSLPIIIIMISYLLLTYKTWISTEESDLDEYS